jgi:hypothetical protein
MNVTVFLICLSMGSGGLVVVACVRGVAGAFCAAIPAGSKAKINEAKTTLGAFTIDLLDRRTGWCLQLAENTCAI